jgi:hypothetical protein
MRTTNAYYPLWFKKNILSVSLFLIFKYEDQLTSLVIHILSDEIQKPYFHELQHEEW